VRWRSTRTVYRTEGKPNRGAKGYGREHSCGKLPESERLYIPPSTYEGPYLSGIHGLVENPSTPSPDSTRSVGFALTKADIDEFKAIVSQESGLEMDDKTAWNRVTELLNLYRMVLGPIPEDGEAPGVQTSSHLPSGPSP